MSENDACIGVGFKSKFTYVDAEYFALSLKETAIAKAARGRPVPSIEQIRHVALTMPSGTDVEKRDRALSPSRS
jgi:hypothetical protein